MKPIAPSIVAALSFTLCSPARAEDPVINGQVFIATQGGENFKLALVSVSLYPEAAARAFVAARDAANRDRLPKIDHMVQTTKSASDQATDLWKAALHQETEHYMDDSYRNQEEKAEKLMHELDDAYGDWLDVEHYVHSSLYYFDGMASPLAITKTDADGKFRLSVPTSGTWVLRANASRETGEKTEYYSWLVAVPVDGPTTVMLANDNQFSSVSETCLVRNGTRFEESAYRGLKRFPEALEKFAKQDAEAQRVVAQAAEQERRVMLARLPQLIKESQARALKKHPDLGSAGSPLNKQFVARYQSLQTKKDARLQEPDWPEKLADECADPASLAAR